MMDKHASREQMLCHAMAFNHTRPLSLGKLPLPGRTDIVQGLGAFLQRLAVAVNNIG